MGEFCFRIPICVFLSRGTSIPSTRATGKLGCPRTRVCNVVSWLRNFRRKALFFTRAMWALVADFHRTLINGGIYMYPPDANKPNRASCALCARPTLGIFGRTGRWQGQRRAWPHTLSVSGQAARAHTALHWVVARCRSRGKSTRHAGR